jgi:hypothetical protein
MTFDLDVQSGSLIIAASAAVFSAASSLASWYSVSLHSRSLRRDDEQHRPILLISNMIVRVLDNKHTIQFTVVNENTAPLRELLFTLIAFGDKHNILKFTSDKFQSGTRLSDKIEINLSFKIPVSIKYLSLFYTSEDIFLRKSIHEQDYYIIPDAVSEQGHMIVPKLIQTKIMTNKLRNFSRNFLFVVDKSYIYNPFKITFASEWTLFLGVFFLQATFGFFGPINPKQDPLITSGLMYFSIAIFVWHYYNLIVKQRDKLKVDNEFIKDGILCKGYLLINFRRFSDFRRRLHKRKYVIQGQCDDGQKGTG